MEDPGKLKFSAEIISWPRLRTNRYKLKFFLAGEVFVRICSNFSPNGIGF